MLPGCHGSMTGDNALWFSWVSIGLMELDELLYMGYSLHILGKGLSWWGTIPNQLPTVRKIKTSTDADSHMWSHVVFIIQDVQHKSSIPLQTFINTSYGCKNSINFMVKLRCHLSLFNFGVYIYRICLEKITAAFTQIWIWQHSSWFCMEEGACYWKTSLAMSVTKHRVCGWSKFGLRKALSV